MIDLDRDGIDRYAFALEALQRLQQVARVYTEPSVPGIVRSVLDKAHSQTAVYPDTKLPPFIVPESFIHPGYDRVSQSQPTWTIVGYRPETMGGYVCGSRS